MAVFLLLNSVGYTVYAHYCDDMLKDASLILNTTESCCAEEEQSNTEPSEMDCCQEQDVLIKIEDQFLKSDVSNAETTLPILYLSSINLPNINFIQRHAECKLNRHFLDKHKGIPVEDITILQQVFRI
jgi:hypothetical protein